MKLRIRGNSIRFRISITELETLSSGLALRESTNFGDTELVYAVQPADCRQMSATFENNTITLMLPTRFIADWSANNVVGFEEMFSVGNKQTLKLLIEKDYKCLDVSTEDQSDFFDNPSKSC